MSSKAEIKIGQPAMYDRKARDASYWIRLIHAYISLNSHIYDIDNKKVMFILSFCREGATNSWALGCYKNAMKDDGTFMFLAWKTFCKDFAKTFISSTAEQDTQ